MSIWAIGDVHGKIKSYEKLLASIHKGDADAYTLQVGDMGMGFSDSIDPNVPTDRDFWITGNHDNCDVCINVKGYLGDFGWKEILGQKIFWIRGAMSTDKEHRTPGITWWDNEELPYRLLNYAIDLYREVEPEIVISHDCPAQLRREHFNHRDWGRTVEALGQMLNNHSPKVWAFGHHHISLDRQVFGTRFVCLPELGWKKLF